ncbi:hypothetical protein VP395_12025 [Mariniflexile soesokkakense]|uniref:Uncharacterized protein n=1 Tax=Mariniflexile soesokkakense TaxID=1343160 RepID=A0ABV0ABH7_9FLAO
MKKTTLILKFFLTILCMGFIQNLNARTTYEDNFSSNVSDFFTSNISGTIWQGTNVNTSAGANTTSSQVAKSENGSLFLASSNGGFEDGQADGLHLYRTVTEGNDFEVSVQLVGSDFSTFTGGVASNYNSAGILVRDANHQSANFVYGMFFDLFNNHSMIKRIKDGVQQELVNNSASYALSQYSWIKMTKTGSAFKLYLSTEGGVTWVETQSTGFPKLNNVNLEGGIAQCKFFTDGAQLNKNSSAILDNYKLVVGSSLGVTEVSAISPITTYSTKNSIVVNNKLEKTLESIKFLLFQF